MALSRLELQFGNFILRIPKKYRFKIMNIAFFVSSLSFGGAEKQAVSDANLVGSSDLEYVDQVYLITFRSGALLPMVDSDVTHVILEKKNYVHSAFRLAAMIKKEKIDVIHASLFASMTIAALASLITPVKVIWHFHSHEYDIPLKSRLAFRWLARLAGVKKILFVNRELMAHFCFLDFPKEKQVVLYNHSELVPVSASAGTSDKIVHIGYLGRVVDLKRVAYLVDLARYLTEQKKFHGFQIHVVGDGDARDKIMTQVEQAGLAKYFVFHGFQSDVQAYYSRFDLFVNPSSEECLCMSMIDAGIMGLPVVAFDVGGNNEIVINDQTGYIVSDKDGFFSRCFELIQDSEKRKQYGEAAKYHCKEQFGKDRHLAELRQLHEAFL
ncbi:glycosyl transferase WbbG [Desulfotignum phosphitoxidans DSM 13687]|uniref:Glycosyl transferase WbbG n=1 Tax=Desulfotignum phosphitoxidans DSM 13687 TaxID=1286635 RepID=S0G0C4_9BACT|nr:glycosyl transferase WbbG [Desulfotignum phosphitoxidans DSM 13687]